MSSIGIVHVNEEFAKATIGKRVVVQKSANLLSHIFPCIPPSTEEMIGTIYKADVRGFRLKTDQGCVKCLWNQWVGFEDEGARE